MPLSVVEEQADRAPERPPPRTLPWWASGPALVGLLSLGGALLHLAATPFAPDSAVPGAPVLAGLSAGLFGVQVMVAGLWARALGGGTTAQLGAGLAALGATVLWQAPGATGGEAALATAAARCGVLLAAVLLLNSWRPALGPRGWLVGIAAVSAVLVAPGSGSVGLAWLAVGPVGLALLAIGWAHRATLAAEGANAGCLTGLLVTTSALLVVAATGTFAGVGPNGIVFAVGVLLAVCSGLVLELVSARRGSRVFLLSVLLLLLLQSGVAFWRMAGGL